MEEEKYYSLNQKIIGTSPDVRKSSLKRLIELKKIVRIIEAHNPLSALIAENIYVKEKNFIGMSSFGASAPYKQLYDFFGISSKNLVKKILDYMKKNEKN